MIFLSVLAALVLEHYQQWYRRDRLAAPFLQWAHALNRFFNSGLAHHGAIAACIALLPLFLLGYLSHQLSELSGGVALAWLVDTLILSAAIDFKTISDRLQAVSRTLQSQDLEATKQVLADWEGQPLAVDFDAAGLTSRALQVALLFAHRRVLAPIFWFVLMPGTSGLLVYLGTGVLARRWVESGSEFGRFAETAYRLLDWFPARLTALSFAVVGNFEESLHCWRTQTKGEPKDSSRIVLASGAGALGVHFEPSPGLPWGVRNGDLGTGDFPRIEHLQNAEGLLARMLVFVVLALLLITLGSLIDF